MGKKGSTGVENSKKAAGQAKKQEAADKKASAAAKQAEAEEEADWSKGSKKVRERPSPASIHDTVSQPRAMPTGLPRVSIWWYWQAGKKQQDVEAKKQRDAEKKEEKAALEAEEAAELAKVKKAKGAEKSKVTQAEISRKAEEEAKLKEKERQDEERAKNDYLGGLSENTNKKLGMEDARSIEEAIGMLDIDGKAPDKGPEKRLKQVECCVANDGILLQLRV